MNNRILLLIAFQIVFLTSCKAQIDNIDERKLLENKKYFIHLLAKENLFEEYCDTFNATCLSLLFKLDSNYLNSIDFSNYYRNYSKSEEMLSIRKDTRDIIGDCYLFGINYLMMSTKYISGSDCQIIDRLLDSLLTVQEFKYPDYYQKKNLLFFKVQQMKFDSIRYCLENNVNHNIKFVHLFVAALNNFYKKPEFLVPLFETGFELVKYDIEIYPKILELLNRSEAVISPGDFIRLVKEQSNFIEKTYVLNDKKVLLDILNYRFIIKSYPKE